MNRNFTSPFIHPLPPNFPGAETLAVEPFQVVRQGAVAALEMGPKGFWGLSHRQGGRSLRLSSALDPAAEDRTMVEKFPLDPSKGVLCLGLGLGYLLDELAERLTADAPLWVMEARPELAAAAFMSRDFSKLLARPGFRLFIGPFGQTPPWGADEAPPQVLTRPATARFFAAEYPLAAKPKVAANPVKTREIRKVIAVQSGYYLDREIEGALKTLGLKTAVWNFERGPTGRDENFHRLLSLIKDFRPDMVLTVNHLGFDGEGLMDDLFTRLKLPVASWFVDSPLFILGDGKPSEFVSVFSWDSDYLKPLKAKGFGRVRHLPLAADDRYFKAGNNRPPQRQAAFVGDTLTAATLKYLGKLVFSETVLAEVDAAAREFLAGPELIPSAETVGRLMKGQRRDDTPENRRNLEALITWRASRLYRLEILSALDKNSLTVAGDDNWPILLGKTARYLGPLDYYSQLPGFYQTSQVNLNITSAQMKGGLNQRIFDVPAAGGFLLTDHRSQLEGLFEIGREVATYSGPEEARDKARWFLNNPAARRQMAGAAHQRVMRDHLYHHRLAEMLKVMAAKGDRT